MDDASLVQLALEVRRAPGIDGGNAVAGIDSGQPNRLAYALGWLVASSIVSSRYADSALDALPIHHPDNGWDRFVLTRRATSRVFAHESANRFGLIMLTGPDAPRITSPGGAEVLALGNRLQDDSEAALASVAEYFPCRQQVTLDDQDRGWQLRRRTYPRLYRAVAELVAEYPGMMAAREIFIDTEAIEGAYHPLYLHSVSSEPTFTYDWFLVQHGGYSAFFRTHGGRAIYQTERGGWSNVKRPITEHTLEEMKSRMRAWLRISGTPNPTLD